MSGLREALAVDSLRSAGQLRMQVSGESMLPTLWPGDVVSVVRESLPDVHPGDLILAIREGRLFLHRFVSHTQDGGFIARGDSVSQPDLPYPSNAFLGKVVSRNGESVALSTALGLSRRALSFSLCYAAPLRRLALCVHQWRRAKRSGTRVTAESL